MQNDFQALLTQKKPELKLQIKKEFQADLIGLSFFLQGFTVPKHCC